MIVTMRFGAARLAVASLVLACVVEQSPAGTDGPEPTETGDTTGVAASTGAAASTSTGSSSLPEQTSSSTTAAMPMTSSSSGASSTGSGPVGPSCSVQVVTHDVLLDPLPRGEEEGLFPPPIAEALESYCGCHTLRSNAQNLEWPALKAPGGTLFLEYADLSRPLGEGTLGSAMRDAVSSYLMPPGSCPWPSDASGLLEDWFAQGMPDGASYVPP